MGGYSIVPINQTVTQSSPVSESYMVGEIEVDNLEGIMHVSSDYNFVPSIHPG